MKVEKDVQLKWKRWAEELSQITPCCLVFLDESGINTDTIRRYGRFKGKRRVVHSAMINTPETTALLSSIRLNGTTVPISFQGALNKEVLEKSIQ